MSLVVLFLLISLSGLVYTGHLPSVQATTSTSWNPKVQCTPQIVRITDITANQTGSASFSASPFSPGITTTVSGGTAKRWLTPGPTPPGWNSPGPACSNSNGKSLFVEIDGIERDSISIEDSATNYDPTNGGTSHPTTDDHTFNIFDPAVVPNFSSSCTSPSDPTCYGRIHSEIDHDWLAAGYCGTSTTCDPSTLASQTSYASTKIDIQGFVYWDPSHLSAGYHNYNGWEIHPVTAWRLSGQQDFSISANPTSLSFPSGGTGTFTTTISGSGGFTGTVTLTTSTTPSSGITATCNPSTISGGSGNSQCTLGSSTPGTYTVTVTGHSNSPSITHSATVSVTVTKPSTPDFTLSANPSSLSLPQGASATSTISLTSLNSFSGTVNLSDTVIPSGPSASLNPTMVSLSANSGGSASLKISTGNTGFGSYTINVTGTSGSLSHSVAVTVTVTPPQDFTISANPSSLILGQGSSGTITPFTVTTSGDRTWFESSYLADSFYAQGLIWMFYEDSSVSCENMAGCLFYTTSSTGSSWATPVNLNVHVTDSDFSVYSNGSNVYYVRYDESVFQADCGRNVQFRSGSLLGTGTINWQAEQTALKAGSTFTYENDEVIVDSSGQAWIAFLSNSRSGCGGTGTELPQIIHSSGTNYASWTTPFTLSVAHSNNWHVALVSLGAGQIYASYWLGNADLHGKLYNGTNWGIDEQISATTTQNDVNAWLFNSGTNVYAIYFDNGPETFNFAARSSSGTWTTSVIGVGESRTGTKFSSSYYSFPDAASFDPTHNQFYLFWMNATLQRIDQWKGSGNSWTKTTQVISTGSAPYPDSIISFITPPRNGFPPTGGIFYITGSSSPFTYHFAALPLSGSSTGTFTVTITSQNGFAGTVNLTTSVNPATGLTVTCNPTSVNGGSGSSSCTVTSTTAGNYNVTVTGTSGSLSHSTSVSVLVQSSSPDFSISANPTSTTVNAGSLATSTITVAPQNGFSGTVTLTVTTNSTNLACSLSSSSITGASGTSTLSCHGSPAANYLATVTGTSGSLSHSATVTFQILDFGLSASPTIVSATVGTAGNSSIAVSPLNGFTGTVNLATTTNSTNLSCTLSQSKVVSSGSSTLSCNSSVAANYLATATGTSGGLSHAVQVTYHVTATPDFTISANPTTVSVTTGTAGTSTITVAPLNGFTGTVTLAVATNSTSLACKLTPTTITGGSGTSTLSCTGSANGNFLSTVTGSSGSLSHSASVTYHVAAPPDFTISSNPTVVAVTAGVAGSSTITVTSQNGFTGTVSLSVVTNSTSLSCNLSNTNIPGGTGTSNLSCTSNLAGNYLATVTGSNNTLSHSTTVTYRFKPNPDFTVTASPTSLKLNAGVVGNSTISVNPLNGFAGTVNLSVTTNSTNLQCTLTQTTVSGGSGTSTLSCNSTSAGNYLANVSGSNGTVSHSAFVAYQAQDFGIAANPPSESVGAGIPGNSTITITSLNGFANTVNLAVNTNSTNLVCTLSSSTVAGGSGTSDLSCASLATGNYLANVTGTSGALSHAASVTYHVVIVLAKDFTISANPQQMAVNAGSLGNSTITVTPENGFTGTVNLSMVSNSTNLTCTLSPTTISGGSGNSILSCRGSPFGNYLANVTGTSGSLSHSVGVVYQVVDFSISTSPISVTMQAYQLSQSPHPPPGNSTATVSPLNGFSGTVSMVVTTNSTNILCALSPTSISGGSGTTTLSCSSNVEGNYLATVTAKSGTLSHSATVAYHVTDFSVTASPTSISVNEGVPGNSTITVSPFNGFSGTVALSVSPSSPNLACSLSTTSLPSGSGTSTLSCTASSPSQGLYSALVTGTSGGVSRSATVAYRITVPDFTMSANPSSMSFVQGSSGTTTLTLTSINGLSGSISLSAAISPTAPQTSFNPATVTLTNGGSGSSILNVTSGGVAPGTYNVNVTATNGSLAHSLIVIVTITSASKPSYALVVSYEGFVYKLYPNNTLVQIAQPVTTQLSVVAWRPDGSCAIIAGNAAVLIKYDGTTLTTVPTGIATSVNFLSAAWRPDGSYALIGGSGGILLKYDCNTVSQVSNSFAVSFRAVAWKPDGSQALMVTYFGKIYQYSAATGAIIQLTSPTGQSLDTVAWNPNGSYALISGSGGAILRFDGTTFTVLNTAGVYSSTLTVRYVSFNPTGSLALLVGDSGLVLTYDGTTLTALHAITSSTLYSVSWSNGTAYIAGGSGALITYSGGVETTVPNNTFSGFRSIAWKP